MPENVFAGAWRTFLFCESDRIFDLGFVSVVIRLLERENSHVACLINLDETDVTRLEEGAATIFVDSSVTGIRYMGALEDRGAAGGWLYTVNRYICSSDIGEWCIYCEKDNDIAVVGLRDVGGVRGFEQPLKKLGAKPIEELIDGGASPLFPFDHLIPSWREGLLKNYGDR
ncbi:hypothetical protein C0Z17_15175 [Trinickia caryophylli]|nr:hypothetical protein C0Z17_15175 [Trinickia caryophylli]